MKKRNYKKSVKIVVFMVIAVMMTCPPVYATATVTSKMNNLTELVMSIIKGAGAIVLAWGVFDFASAYQAHDSQQQTQSLKKVVAGLLMFFAQDVVNMLK